MHVTWPQRTDQSLLEQAEELIREKIFQRTNGDVPYRVSQENLAWYTSNKDASYVIHHNILVPNVRVKVLLIPLSSSIFISALTFDHGLMWRR
jgi:GTPase Era involved in 16S rRNA processing